MLLTGICGPKMISLVMFISGDTAVLPTSTMVFTFLMFLNSQPPSLGALLHEAKNFITDFNGDTVKPAGLLLSKGCCIPVLVGSSHFHAVLANSVWK